MTRPTFLCDVDDVCGAFKETAVAVMCEVTGEQLRVEDMTSWYLESLLTGRPEDEIARILRETFKIVKAPGWCSRLPVLPGAKEGVRRLREIGEVVFLTAPFDAPEWEYERRHWLARHFRADRQDEVIQTGRKWQVWGHVFMDDKTETLKLWRDCHPDGDALRWWTQHSVHEEYRGRTVHQWDHAAEVFETHRGRIGGSWLTR